MLYLVEEYATSDRYDEFNEMVIGVFETKELAERCITAIIEEAEKDFNARPIEEDENDRFTKLEDGYIETVDCVTLCSRYDITEIELNKRI